jgi:hypothetical protein
MEKNVETSQKKQDSFISRMFKDENDINEKSIVGFLALFV